MHAAAQTSRDPSRQGARKKPTPEHAPTQADKTPADVPAAETLVPVDETAVLPCTHEQIRSALVNTLESPEFRSAPQLRAFLEFVVRASLDNKHEKIKGYTIAVEALGRAEDFNPVTDPIVRVEAARLRRRLEKYYGGSGVSDAVRITIPKGSYAPVFNLAGSVSAPETVLGRPDVAAGILEPGASGPAFEDILPAAGDAGEPARADEQNPDALSLASALPASADPDTGRPSTLQLGQQSGAHQRPDSLLTVLHRRHVSLAFAAALALGCFLAGLLAGSL